ncbi:MAG: ATP12 family chaperone protein [Stellaceae bacterium]
MKRVYRTVATAPAPGGHTVTLDGKPMRTPGKRDLVVPTLALAAAIAAEWDAQHPDIRPETMPLTRLAATALDRTATLRDQVIRETANYAGTDLLCYRAEHPPALAARQHAAWQPLIEWAAGRFDAALETTAGIVPKPQRPATLAALAGAVAAHDDFRLTALHTATAACGSLVIALALIERRVDAGEAFAVSQIDETFQIEAWGEDAEAMRRRAALAADIAATARFLALLAV